MRKKREMTPMTDSLEARCIYCGGAFLYGEPPHICDINGVETPYCRDCIEYISSASWPFDEPYPFTIYQRGRPERCDA